MEDTREATRTHALHARPVPSNREQKLYMNKKPSIVLISTSETDRGLEKVSNGKPGTSIDCSPSSQYTRLVSGNGDTCRCDTWTFRQVLFPPSGGGTA